MLVEIVQKTNISVGIPPFVGYGVVKGTVIGAVLLVDYARGGLEGSQELFEISAVPDILDSFG